MNYNQSFASVQQKLRQYAVPVVLLLLVITMIGSGATYAWIVSHAGPITNKFELMSASMNLEEDVTDADGDGEITLKKDVHIKNTGEAPLYARINLVLEVQDADGNPVANPITYNKDGKRTDLQLSLNKYIKFVDLMGNNWIEANGIYYYTQPLKENDTTSMLFTSAKTKPNVYLYDPTDQNADRSAYHIVLTVMGEAIQKNGVEEAWTAVDLNGDTLVAGGRS